MKKKNLLLRLVVLVTAMMCALGASAYDFEYRGYYYNILTDSTVTITYKTYAGNSYSGNVTIPEKRQCDHPRKSSEPQHLQILYRYGNRHGSVQRKYEPDQCDNSKYGNPY